MLLLVHFGWAKPVPINPRNFKNPRRDDYLVSLAGVCVNFLLALVSMLTIYIYAIAGGKQRCYRVYTLLFLHHQSQPDGV
jgi:Zn-dependent protease